MIHQLLDNFKKRKQIYSSLDNNNLIRFIAQLESDSIFFKKINQPLENIVKAFLLDVISLEYLIEVSIRYYERIVFKITYFENNSNYLFKLDNSNLEAEFLRADQATYYYLELNKTAFDIDLFKQVLEPSVYSTINNPYVVFNELSQDRLREDKIIQLFKDIQLEKSEIKDLLNKKITSTLNENNLINKINNDLEHRKSIRNKFVVKLNEGKLKILLGKDIIDLESYKVEYSIQKNDVFDLTICPVITQNYNLDYKIKFHSPKNRSWRDIDNILYHANKTEIDNLLKILDITSTSLIKEKLQSKSKNLLNSFDEYTYLDVVDKVMNHLSINDSHLTIAQKEQKIVEKSFQKALNKLTKEERLKLEQEFIKEAEKRGLNNVKGFAGVGGSMLLAQASGFGVYMMATTALGALTSALGITLSFGVYTGMTKALSVIIGPVGWIALGGAFVWKAFDSDFKRLTPAVINIHILRKKYLDEDEMYRF
ncbi:YaaW family protein [Flammeovirga kamogawensis]|uniref:Uncharacterized protein n=1 Tax=Flammeovirga kamogawensis TaxID=373891 RepID=A0ABX8H0D9_9BACT|nr:YaaW family protein [Flammeovirga kamogawensis]MBB6462259.1 uncharacterized protein YaaW (UPF0174 family) [Flammeovirga kamogawensis]QWG09343.1 hypothetical protein KM029_22315 [Flammeovirga kamogawensis]TRX64865.1 hypothetical protein EO216_20225 [Flammeovirga kamogawensis]